MILSKLNLEQYIQRCQLQQSELQTSTIFSDFELKKLSETYDLQIELATAKLNRLQNPDTDTIKKSSKLHTLVFYKNYADRESFFFQFLDKFANPFNKQNIASFNSNKIYIDNTTDIIAIHHVFIPEIVSEFVMNEKLDIEKYKIHSIPMIIGCDFAVTQLPAEIIERCNIINLD